MKINGLKEVKTRWCKVWMNVRLTALRAMLLVGIVTTLTGLCLYFFSPKAESRGAKIKQLQQDLQTGKISQQQFKTGFSEAIKK